MKTGNRSNNISGVKGVTFDKARNNWKARIYLRGKEYYLISTTDFVEAVAYRFAVEQCLNKLLPNIPAHTRKFIDDGPGFF